MVKTSSRNDVKETGPACRAAPAQHLFTSLSPRRGIVLLTAVSGFSYLVSVMPSPSFFVHCATTFLLALFLCSATNAAVYTKTSDWNAPEKTNLRPIPTQAPKEWEHPGVFVQRRQLNYVSRKVAQGAQPWSEAFTSMLNHNYTSPTRTEKPYNTVQCGPTSTPNIGCYQEREDSMAAYTNALAWWITRKQRYADKAIHYMDSWSSTIEAHNNSNAPLQAAWSVANWVRAGDIMRYAHGG